MIVKNYYNYSEQELEKTIQKIRDWLIQYQNNENRDKVNFALEVALEAKDSYQRRKEDYFIQLVLDKLIEV
jgi:hypothetical protein